MMVLFFVLILCFNLFVSWSNAYFVGREWHSIRSGPLWDRIVAWCALVQSVCGFTTLLAPLYAFIAVSAGWLPVTTWKVLFDLTYLAIAIPAVGTGFIIWAHSVREAILKRDPLHIGVAGLNTAVQASNTYSMVRHGGDAFKSITNFFLGDEDTDVIKGLVALVVVLAACSSAVLTYVCFRKGVNATKRERDAARLAQFEAMRR